MKIHEATYVQRMLDTMMDEEIAKALGVTKAAVNKWRNGTNGVASSTNHMAKLYLDHNKTEEDDPLYLVSVPVKSRKKFLTIIKMFNLEVVELED